MYILHEKLVGIVERVTFHSPQTGWSLLKISPLHSPANRVAVRVHQAQVFAGATMEFTGHWRVHPKYGEQFEATHALERKPASSAALERYLGSGLIDGVGPKTARKIVTHFGADTLGVFEDHIDRLTEVRGIAEVKLTTIRAAWKSHRAIRDVMLFLQEYGVSTLFAVKIFKVYGDSAITVVRDNPYQLARDIYGIGFFSADRIALTLGFARNSSLRIAAGVEHVLDASREHGHCYMTREQILSTVTTLLTAEPSGPDVLETDIDAAMSRLNAAGSIRTRHLPQQALPAAIRSTQAKMCCYYATSLYWAEERTSRWIRDRLQQPWRGDLGRITHWLERFCAQAALKLSIEQRAAVQDIVGRPLSILTGGPGCGKTTTTRVIVKLLQAMGKKVLLAAPTGRAAQRMTEVIGLEARTLHRLLEWNVRENAFSRNRQRPLEADFVIIDETSMLDITLAADLFAAIASSSQALLIGDPEQLPAIGAGNVLSDMLACQAVPRAALHEIFRQAQTSQIVQAAHAINHGHRPAIPSPLAKPDIWQQNCDCLFIDAEQATQEQLRFVRRAKAAIATIEQTGEKQHLITQEGKSRGELVRVEGQVTHIQHKVTATQVGADAARANGAGTNETEANETDVHAAGVNEAEVHEAGVDEAGVHEAGVNEAGLHEAAASETANLPATSFIVPAKFLHIRWDVLAHSTDAIDELKAVLRRIPAHSALRYGMSAVDVVVRLYSTTLPKKLGRDAEVQVLTPMQRGPLGAQALNRVLQQAVNPPAPDKLELTLGERILRAGDRVMQRRNNYEHNVFNGDIGRITHIDPSTGQCKVTFGVRQPAMHEVTYRKEDLSELALAYAITIHKSQGSEFECAIIPITTQHYTMLFRNLIYTALTRAKKMAVFVGTRTALDMAIENVDTQDRQTTLPYLLNPAAFSGPSEQNNSAND